MKQIFIVLWLLILGNIAARLFAQPTHTIPTNQAVLLNSDISSSVVRFEMQQFELRAVTTPNGTAHIVQANNTTPLLKAGSPDLPKMTASVIIPPTHGTSIEVISADYTDYPNVLIAPSKGNLLRNQNPQDVPYAYSSVYEQNAFFPNNIVQLRAPYILRDHRAQTIVAQPFRYNPVTHTLRVYHSLTVRLSSNTAIVGENILAHAAQPTPPPTAEWRSIYERQLLNYAAVSGSRYENLSDTPAKLLIISHANFDDLIEELAFWKTRRGIPTEVVDVANIGDENAIKEFIRNRYNTQQITHVLLVGDSQFVPALYSGLAQGYSDVQYGCLLGNDSYPEVFVGRFSGENIAHIRTQINRTLEYERNPSDLSEWYKKAGFVASDQGPGDDNEMDWEHERNMRTDFMNFGYTTGHELYDGSQGGADAAGNPSANAFMNILNEGMTAITYTGHGYAGGCATTGLDMAQIPSLQNQHRLPFFWSVACVNGEFVDATCFAEALLRSENNGEAVGCIATLMSTVNQSWNPPMSAQDEMVDILTEQYAEKNHKSFAGISYNGCMQMNDDYGTDGEAMTDSWTCFGDPTLMVRTDIPQHIAATHNPTVFIGSNSFAVAADSEGALVSLLVNEQIIATAPVVDGIAQLSFAPINIVGEMLITVSGYNYIPYLGSATIVPSNAPYITTVASTFADTNNNIAENGEAGQWNIDFKNVGLLPANSATATLSTNSSYVTINDNTVTIGNVAAETNALVEGAFSFTIAPNTPDQTLIPFTISITDSDGNTWQSYVNLTVNAPDLRVTIITIDDSFGGNNNGRLDPNETVILNISTQNVGHRAAESGTANLNTTNNNITFANNNIPMPALVIDAEAPAIFGVMVSAAAPVGSTIDFTYQVNANNANLQYSFSLPIGLIVEDFESGDFAQFNWQNNSNQPWQIDNNIYFEGEESARSGNIDNDATTVLEISRNMSSADSISFYKRVSTEQDWDYLHFYIDNIEVGTWSGLSEWSREAYFVSPGQHTFRWTYSKDEYYTDNEDAVWIDFVQLPAEGNSNTCLADAGLPILPTVPLYANETFTINSTAYNTTLVQWYVVANPLAPHTIISANTTGTFSLPAGNYWVYTINTTPNNSLTNGMNIDNLGSALDCVAISSPQTLNLQVVGIETNAANVQLNLSPIPATTQLTVQVQNPHSLPQEVQVYNHSGQIVFYQQLNAVPQQQLTIPVANWSNGSYIVVVKQGTKVVTQAFVKQ